jgi:hypothetical protein
MQPQFITTLAALALGAASLFPQSSNRQKANLLQSPLLSQRSLYFALPVKGANIRIK